MGLSVVTLAGLTCNDVLTSMKTRAVEDDSFASRSDLECIPIHILSNCVEVDHVQPVLFRYLGAE